MHRLDGPSAGTIGILESVALAAIVFATTNADDGVFLFGLGDFSRTFLILLASAALPNGRATSATASVAMLLYAAHDGVSALAAYPAGHAGDRGSKLRVLLVGYVLGVLTNGLLCIGSGSLVVLVPAILLSGVYTPWLVRLRASEGR